MLEINKVHCGDCLELIKQIEEVVKKCWIDLGSEYHCINLEVLLLGLGVTCISIAVIIVITYILGEKNEWK